MGKSNELLPESLRLKLPGGDVLGGKRKGQGHDAMVWAKLLARKTKVSFYVVGCDRGEGNWALLGYLARPGMDFPLSLRIEESVLQGYDWAGEEPAERDENFVPERWETLRLKAFPKLGDLRKESIERKHRH